MTVIPSRESFERTRVNKEMIQKAHDAIAKFANQDLEGFKNLTLDDMLKDRNESRYKGQYFSIDKKTLYPVRQRFIQQLSLTNTNASAFLEDPEPVIAVIPDKKSYDRWTDKLWEWANRENKKVWYIRDNTTILDQNLDQEIKDYFVFRSVKNRFFGLRLTEKVAKDATKYCVVNAMNGGNTRYCSKKVELVGDALELHNYSRNILGLEEAEDLEEATEQMKDVVYNTTKDVQMFTYSSTIESYTYVYQIRAKKLQSQMKEIRWLEYGSVEYNTVIQPIIDEARKVAKIQQKIQNATAIHNVDTKWLERVRNRLARFPHRIEKFGQVLQNIKDERSFRGKMFHNNFLVNSYYQQEINRQEMRKILQLKS
jgi:hypothetical protein